MIKFFWGLGFALLLLGGCFNNNFQDNDNNSGVQRIERPNGQGFYEITYSEDGQINTIESFKNDSLNGFSYSFHGNGNVYEKAKFENGKRIGHNLIYNEDGMLDFYRYFIKPGKLVFRRAYQNGKVVKEEGALIVLEPLNIFQEKGDSMLSIQITTVIPPDCFRVTTDIKNITTDIKEIEEKQSIVDSVQLAQQQSILDSVNLIDQEEFVYDMRLNDAGKTLFIKSTLHESFMDSVTVFMSVSDKNELLKKLEERNDYIE